MKVGDKLVYIGSNNEYFSNDKKYIITEVEYCPGESSLESVKKYIYFKNDLGGTECLIIKNLKNDFFIEFKEYRKLKIQKLNGVNK